MLSRNNYLEIPIKLALLKKSQIPKKIFGTDSKTDFLQKQPPEVFCEKRYS